MASVFDVLFLVVFRPPPRPPLFPYTTLFRSLRRAASATTARVLQHLPASLKSTTRLRCTRRRRSHAVARPQTVGGGDRKSTRLNSSHVAISYAVFCLKKKKRIEGMRKTA